MSFLAWQEAERYPNRLEKAKVVLLALILAAIVWLGCWVMILCNELQTANQQIDNIRQEVQKQNQMMQDLAKRIGLCIE